MISLRKEFLESEKGYPLLKVSPELVFGVAQKVLVAHTSSSKNPTNDKRLLLWLVLFSAVKASE